MSQLWLETNEREDVAASLRHCVASFKLARDDLHAFKWVILALHSALQGSCVNHLTTTTEPVGPLTERNTREWLAYFDSSRSDPDVKCPDTKIADLAELLKRVRRPNSAGNGLIGSEILLSDAELVWWTRIHTDIRNQFVHFSPMGWSVELSGMSDLTSLTVRLIREIESKQWAFRHQNLSWRKGLKAVLNELEILGLKCTNP